jgi:hypothetical protein
MTTTPPTVRSSTPWGWADSVCEIAPGIIQIETPSHGGIWLSPDRLEVVAPDYRAFAAKWSHGWGEAWFEEDCAAYAVIATWPELFATPDRPEAIVQEEAENVMSRALAPYPTRKEA